MWKDVEGYENYYQIEPNGTVRGVDRTIILSNGRTKFIKGKIIKPKISRGGYLTIALSKNGVAKTYFLHRLLAITFLANPQELKYVNHISGDKLDNSLYNLEWTTHSNNVKHAYRIGLNKHFGGNHSNAIGVIDNTIGQEFSCIKDWCIARGINYSTGRNLLSGHNKSKTISLTGICKIKP